MFGIIRKKEEVLKNTSCCCGNAPAPEGKAESACTCNASASGNTAGEGCCCGGGECSIRSIKVLGSGCRSCHALYEAGIAAVKELGMSLEVEYITDMEKIMQYGVMRMPALVVNEKVVSAGRVLKTADIIRLLKDLGYC